MPRFKFTMLSNLPLCLKFRGRIVGAISRSKIGIYIATGLLLVSSFLLMIVLSHTKSDPEIIVKSEPQIEEPIKQEVPVPAQQVNGMTAMLPKPMPEEDTLVISQSIKGPIQVDFGWQFHQVYNEWRYHTGIDISGSVDQRIEAIEKGQVVEIFRDPQIGLTVVIKNNTSIIYYGSLSEVRVSQDDHISAGQTIGVMGHCDAEPYDHLHLAIKKNEQYIDPNIIIHGNRKEKAQK